MKTLAGLVAVFAAASLLSSQAADVKENWEKQCAKCHGPDGKGDTKTGKKLGVKDYSDPKVQTGLKDDKAVKSLIEGLKDGDKTLMKPFGKTISEEEIKALVQHMRTFKN